MDLPVRHQKVNTVPKKGIPRRLPEIPGLEPPPHAWVERQKAATVVHNVETTEPVWLANDDIEAQIVTRKARCEATGALVDIAVMLQVRATGDDAWGDDAYRCDSRRGFVHEHFGPPLVTKPIDHTVEHVPERCASSLEAAFPWGVARAYEHVEAL